MSQSTQQTNTTNLLVPPNAATHVVRSSFTASATATNFNFQQFALDNFPFNPQAAYFDNTNGAADMIVTVMGIDFTLTIPVGTMIASNFPSPANVSINVTGSGAVKIFWLDYPVTIQPPGGVATAVTIAGQPVAVTVTGGQIGIAGNTPVDNSKVTVADASTQLVAANASRTSIEVQAPQTAGIWINKAGGTAGPDLTGCIFLPAGAIYESSIVVNRNAWNYYCDTAGLVIAVIEGS